MSKAHARFRAARWVAAVAVVIAVLAGAAPHIISGPRYGRVVERLLPGTRGGIQIGGGRWTWGAVVALLRGRPAAFEFDHVRVTDPEGTEVLRAARLSGRIERRPSAPRIVLHDLRVESGIWRYARMKDGKVGFLAAFGASGSKAAARASAPKQAREGEAESFAIADAVLEDLDVTFEFSDWGLALQNVRASGSLALPGGGREPVLTFEVRDAEARGGGRLRVLAGADAWQLPFSRARLDRVSTTKDAPDSLFLQASAVATGLSRLSLAGTFTGVYGVSRPRVAAGIDLQARVADASDAIRAVAESRGVAWPPSLAGRGSHLSLNFTGPLARPRITVEGPVSATNGGKLDTAVSLEGRAIEAGVVVTALATAPLLPLALVPWVGGILEGTARGRFDLASASASAQEISLVLTRAPPEARPRIVRVLLGPAPPRGGRAPPRDSWTLNLTGASVGTGTGKGAGLIRVPRLATSFAGGRVVVRGQVGPWKRHGAGLVGEPEIDLLLRLDRISLKKLLGNAFVDGQVSLNARARGRLSDLALAVTLPPRQSLRVLGESFQLPRRFVLALRDQDLLLSPLRLDGPQQSKFTVSGRVDMQGRMALAIGVDAFPFERLPGLAATSLPLAGRISGRVDLAGNVGQPTLAGQLSIDPVTFQGRRVGGGSLTISPTPSGATRARGRVVEGIDVDGTLAAVAGGLRGDLTLRLDRLRLDPFIPTLPGGVSAVSVVSGSIVARVAPGRPAVAEGRLSQLDLTVTPPAGSARNRANVRPITLQAGGEIPFHAEGGDGPIRIGPARFTGTIGAFVIEGESQGGAGAVKGAFRGRVQFDPFAPLTAVWVDRLSGAIDVDLRAGRTGLHDPFRVDGSMTIAAPLSVRTLAVPFEGRIPSGQIRFSGTSVETTALPLTFDAAAVGPLGPARGSVRVSARVTAAAPRPDIRATVSLDRVSVGARGFGTQALVLSGGRLELTNRTLTVRDVSIRSGAAFTLVIGATGGAPGTLHFDSLVPPSFTRLDLPFRGEARGFERSGARIDHAMFALRLQGQRARPFLLSGDIDVVRASMPSTLASPGGQGDTSRSAAAASLDVETTRLDLQLRSRPGAIEVRVPRVPDIRVGVDYHVGGTIKHPTLGGQIRGDGVYSRAVLWLKNLISRP